MESRTESGEEDFCNQKDSAHSECSSTSTVSVQKQLERELKPELNQPGIGIGIAAGNRAESRAAEGRVRRCILRPVKNIEEFGSELEADLLVGTKPGALEE